MKWISVKELLPEIPKGRHGVRVLAAIFDSTYAEINPGHGYHVETVTWDGKNFLVWLTSLGESKIDLHPSFEPITHWMPLPSPPKEEQ